MREEILVWNYGKVLLRQEHFIGAPDVFLVTVAAFIAHGLFGPTDTITRQGAYNEPFYILTKGEVRCVKVYVRLRYVKAYVKI